MRRWVLLCGVMLLFAAGASAQEETPKVEAFGGYSYVRANLGFGIPGFNMNGGSGSVSYNPTEWLGLVADVGGYHVGNIGGESVDATFVTYLFGPKVTYRRGRWTPFVHALFGGAHASGSSAVTDGGARVRPEQTVGFVSGSENAFAMALGGGLDVNATKHIGIRLIQADYLMTRFGVEHSSDTQNNARISAGVVFRW
ncbi:MAG TPA: outer membrane beta-barrel protein [Candidatus Acidoferrales bacterium]|nr:outer membrane beta-barrel protein [Candidatus Acidoferrales bacterium]